MPVALVGCQFCFDEGFGKENCLPVSLVRGAEELHECAWPSWTTGQLPDEQRNRGQQQNDGTSSRDDMEGKDTLNGTRGISDSHLARKL